MNIVEVVNDDVFQSFVENYLITIEKISRVLHDAKLFFFDIRMYYLEIALFCETERALDRLPNIQFLCILDTYFIM